MFLHNISNYLPNNMASLTSRLESSSMMLRETKILEK